MVKEICKAKSLDVLLQTWRDLTLIPPEFITLQLNTEGGEDGLYLPQAFIAMFSSALSKGSVISAVFQRHPMEKKNSLLGEIGDIATSLSSENLRSNSVESVTDILKNLDDAFSRIIIIIYFLSKLVKERGDGRRSHLGHVARVDEGFTTSS